MEIYYFLREERESYACSQNLTLPAEQERKGRGEKGLPKREAKGTGSLTVASALVPGYLEEGPLGGDLSWGLRLLSLVNPLMG